MAAGPIEVERKFVCTPDVTERLKKLGARQMTSQTFTDRYYDVTSHRLTLADHWLRERDGRWELKSPTPGDNRGRRGDTSQSAVYVETTTQEDIVQTVGALLVQSGGAVVYTGVEQLVEQLDLRVFAEFSTRRRRYQLPHHVLVVLDETDFGFTVGEVEQVVNDQQQIDAALHLVDTVVHQLGVSSVKRIPGKMEAYLKAENPALLQLLLDAHILT